METEMKIKTKTRMEIKTETETGKENTIIHPPLLLECILNIASFCDLSTLLDLCQTCKKYNESIKSGYMGISPFRKHLNQIFPFQFSTSNGDKCDIIEKGKSIFMQRNDWEKLFWLFVSFKCCASTCSIPFTFENINESNLPENMQDDRYWKASLIKTCRNDYFFQKGGGGFGNSVERVSLFSNWNSLLECWNKNFQHDYSDDQSAFGLLEDKNSEKVLFVIPTDSHARYMGDPINGYMIQLDNTFCNRNKGENQDENQGEKNLILFYKKEKTLYCNYNDTYLVPMKSLKKLNNEDIYFFLEYIQVPSFGCFAFTDEKGNIVKCIDMRNQIGKSAVFGIFKEKARETRVFHRKQYSNKKERNEIKLLLNEKKMGDSCNSVDLFE